MWHGCSHARADLTECLSQGSYQLQQVLLDHHQFTSDHVDSGALLLQLPLKIGGNLVALSVFGQFLALRLQIGQLSDRIFVENHVLGALFEQQILEVQQTFTLNLHLPVEGLKQLQIFLSLHKQAQIAIRLETLQVVRL